MTEHPIRMALVASVCTFVLTAVYYHNFAPGAKVQRPATCVAHKVTAINGIANHRATLVLDNGMTVVASDEDQHVLETELTVAVGGTWTIDATGRYCTP